MNSNLPVCLLVLAACSAPDGGESNTVPAPAPGNHGDGSLPVEAASHQLQFQIPDGWVVEEPRNTMRKMQCRLPGAEGADASLVVYYFGPDGGSVEANIDRWVGQFEQPDGSPSQERLARSQREVAGLVVYEVGIAGTYVAETAPGSGERVNHEDWSMLSTILESDHGNYFVKLVGPRGAVQRWAASYREFIDSVRP